MDNNSLLYQISRILLNKRGNQGIVGAFEAVSAALNLDGVFVMRTNEIPLLFEIENLWEKEPFIKDRHIILDYTERADTQFVSAFMSNEGASCNALCDTRNIQLEQSTRDFFDDAGIRACVLSTLKSGTEFLGTALYYSREPREWTSEELSTIHEVTELVASETCYIRREELQIYLLKESQRINSELDAERNQFIANLSREIRTPVNSVMGMISIMRHNVENPEVMLECIDRMDKSAKQLMDIINSCVDMTLINNQSMEVSNDWVRLENIMNSVETVILPLAESRGQLIEFEYDHSLAIFSDEAKLRRIIINALSNSCHHANDGTAIALKITADKSGGQDILTIRIFDEVAGVDSEMIKNYFEPYGLEHNGEMHAGTGLSMTILQHLAKLIGATAEIFSDGNGTELVVSVPCEIKGNHAENSVEDMTGIEQSDNAEMYIGRRVLIAEDNVMMGEVLATILGYRGLETDMALNGKEACDRFLSHDPFYYDIIIMNIQMPEMDGLEATDVIRNSGRADASIIPIIGTSSNTNEDDIKLALSSGINMYLTKPVGDKELYEAIDGLIW